MRQSLAKLASASAMQNGLRPKPMALLPPIPLYRRLLRAHRKFLPTEMRLLGDEYVKAEFRAHRNVDNPAHLVSVNAIKEEEGRGGMGYLFFSSVLRVCVADLFSCVTCLQIGFLSEWQMYAQQIEGESWVGEKIDQGKLAKMSGKHYT